MEPDAPIENGDYKMETYLLERENLLIKTSWT